MAFGAFGSCGKGGRVDEEGNVIVLAIVDGEGERICRVGGEDDRAIGRGKHQTDSIGGKGEVDHETHSGGVSIGVGAEFPMTGNSEIGDGVNGNNLVAQVYRVAVATEHDVIKVGKRRSGLEGQYTIAYDATGLGKGETVVAPDATDTETIEAIIGERIPKRIRVAIDVGAVEESTITDGEGGLQLTLVRAADLAWEIEKGADVFVAEGVALAAEVKRIVTVIVAVDGGVLVAHGMDDHAMLGGAAVGDGEIVIADALRVEPKGTVAVATNLPQANGAVGIGLVDGDDGGCAVGAEAVDGESQRGVGERDGGVEVGDTPQGYIAGGVGGHKSEPWLAAGLPPCHSIGEQEAGGEDKFVYWFHIVDSFYNGLYGSDGRNGQCGPRCRPWLIFVRCHAIKREGARYKECRLQMLLTVHRAGWLYVSRVQVAGLNLRRFECLGFFSALHLLFLILHATARHIAWSGVR